MKKMCYHCMEEGVAGGVCTLCGAKANSKAQSDRGMALPLGTELDNGNIIVGERMGNGGFGITYIARDKQYGLIALKEFLPKHMIVGARKDLKLQILADKQAIFQKSLASFRRESRLLNALQHPNVVPVYFDLEENNTAYYGMRLLKGKDLNKHIAEHGILSPVRAMELLCPVMDALSYIHREKQTLHRDLSPDNIFLEADPNSPSGYKPYLIDFGAAYTAMDDFTHSMLGVKKNGYSPLEQNWSQNQQGPFTDVYSFAATFYKAITGEVPPPVDVAEVGYADNKKLLPASAYNPEVGRNVDQVLMHGMALLPRNRIQTMDQFRRDMERAIMADMRGTAAKIPAESQKNSVEPPKIPGEPQRIPAEPPIPPVEPPKPSEVKLGLPVEPTTAQKSQWRRLCALLIDWVVFLALPFAALMGISPIMGLGLGLCLMLVLNTLLLSLEGNGTLGQRLMGLEMNTKHSGGATVASALFYSFLRALVPFALVDELIASAKGQAQSMTDKVTGFSLAGAAAPAAGTPAVQLSPESQIEPDRRPGNGGRPVQQYPVYQNPNPGHPNPGQAPRMPGKTARLRSKNGRLAGQCFTLNQGERRAVGRDPRRADIIVNHEQVSGFHCEIYCENGKWFVRDNNSTNGTFINGKELRKGGICELRNRYVIRLANQEFIFELE